MAVNRTGSVHRLLATLVCVAPLTAMAEAGWQCTEQAGGEWDCRAAQSAPAATPERPAASTESPRVVTNAARTSSPTPPPARRVSLVRPARDPWRQCAPARRNTGSETDRVTSQRQGSAIDLLADNIQVEDNRDYRLQGNVRLSRADQHISGENLQFNKPEQRVSATGNVSYRDSTVEVEGQKLELQLADGTAQMDQVHYRLPAFRARGKASKLMLDGPDVKRLENATYTTCDANQVDWELSADKVELRENKGKGTARNVKLEFKGVPVFYSPYLSFPLDQRRKSGFLLPSVGNSDETGADIRLPYYFNIAPNQDLTLTPRYMDRRGTQIGGEYRRLSRTGKGKLVGEFLPSDDEFGDDRYLIEMEHRARPWSRVSTDLAFRKVSDDAYFEDLGNSLSVSARTHLERHADIRYFGDDWRISALAQGYQTIDRNIAAADRPYQRLPQIRFNAAPQWDFLGLDYRFDSEFVNFDHDDKITGKRIDLTPRIALPLASAAYYVTPAASVRYTTYKLDNTDNDTPDRTTPVFSLDSGAFFDRNISLRGTRYTHTLEPRLFYLYVPNRKQDDLPVFDTGSYDFNFQQLFLENRFTGADRMGDANQLTLALTSRLIEPATGKQRLSASLGSIVYFRDLEVTLPGQTVVDDSTSDIVGELALQMSRAWSLTVGGQWDPHTENTERGQVRFHYKPDDERIFNVGHRFRRGVLEQIDTSLVWPLTRSMRVVGRWNYSLRNDRTLESFAGLQYDSCCWAFRTMLRSYINDDTGARNEAIYMQIEFKGLTEIGDPVEDLLERGILGYRRQ